MDLFVSDEKTGVQNVNWKLLNTYSSFRKLYTLDYNKQTGDIDGRRRHRATKELQYMYEWYHPLSLTNRQGLPKDEKKRIIYNQCELDNSFTESSELKDAIITYKQNFEYLNYKLLQTARGAIVDYLTAFDKIRKKLKKEDVESITELVNMGNSVTAMMKSLPAAISTLDKIEDDIARGSLGKRTSVYGGEEPSSFEDTRV